MEAPSFPDRSRPPQDADLAALFGPAKPLWDDLAAHVRETCPESTGEWKFYSAKSGWQYVVRGKRRNLFYVNPLERRFRASFALGPQAVAAAEQARLPAAVRAQIRASPEYPEGRAVRIEVARAADLKLVKKLLALKVAN